MKRMQVGQVTPNRFATLSESKMQTIIEKKARSKNKTKTKLFD